MKTSTTAGDDDDPKKKNNNSPTTSTTTTSCSSDKAWHVQHQDDPLDWRIRLRYFLSLGIMMDDQEAFDVIVLAQQQQHQQQHGHGHEQHDSNISATTGKRRTTHRRVPKDAPMNRRAESSPIYTTALKGDHGQVDQQMKFHILVMEQQQQQQHVLLQPPIKNGHSNHQPAPDTLDQATLNDSHSLHDDEEGHVSSPGSTLSFCPLVEVHEIPDRRMYSERLLRTLWMTPTECAESMRRNVIEFMAEGYVPEGVFDESDFMERDGKMVHPVCVLLDEPKNARLKQLYYMVSPSKS